MRTSTRTGTLLLALTFAASLAPAAHAVPFKSTSGSGGIKASIKRKIAVGMVAGTLALGSIGGVGIAKYNGMVGMQEQVHGAKSNIEVQLQRRADLIPNLVEVAKGYANHEQRIQLGIAESRIGAARVALVNARNTGDIGQTIAATNALHQAFMPIAAVAEAYPELKANELYRNVMEELKGTEDRIAAERMRYNDAAQAFNSHIKKFPNNVVANTGGFKQVPYFEAEAGATAPVKINVNR